MKKSRILIIVLITGILTSCSPDSTGDVSRVTNFPIITLNGSDLILLNEGGSYDEPGAVAVAGGAELPVVVNSGEGTYRGFEGVDSSKSDQYIVTYSAKNEDGFDGNALRTVWVANTGDLTTNIEGLYTSSIKRAPSFTPSPQYNDKQYVLIWKTGTDSYEISHAVGGYYDLGRGIGPGYAARGAVITANDITSNDFSISQAQFPIWGNTVDITEFTVDASNKTITFTGDGNFGNGTFKVQLKQVQF